MYEESSNPPGRFVPARFFPERRNIPNWNNDLVPRLSGAYDLFGNGRPRAACSGLVPSTNGDDVAQDNEIGLSGTSNFRNDGQRPRHGQGR